MGRLKTALRVLGVVIGACGVLLWPLGVGVNPKRDLSTFHNLTDFGIFARDAAVGVAVGILLVVASYLVPGDEDA
jgi:hypothetical protein